MKCGKKAHHKAGRAIAALRAAILHHHGLAWVQRATVQRFQAFHRQNIGTGKLPGWQQTTIYRHRTRYAIRVSLQQRHCASATIAVAAAFLGARVACSIERVQKRLRRCAASKRSGFAVEGDLDIN